MNGQFPYEDVATKLVLAIVIGLLVGLERQWAHKEVGVRTFSITVVFGMLASLIGPSFVLASLAGTFVIVAFVNIQSLKKDGTLELTTSVSLMVMPILGNMVGQNHYFTAATSAILLTMLLAWKIELSKFAEALLPEEIRSAVLLGLISFVIYPLLPNKFVDPWELVNPRQVWTTVIVISGLGFVNYILLRLYSMRGMYYAAILGGFVNSSAAVAELSKIFSDVDTDMIPRAVSILLLTIVSMFLRNLTILAIFAPRSAQIACVPLATMAIASGLLALLRRTNGASATPNKLPLSSPLSLSHVFTFGAVFVILAALGTLAQRYYGRMGFLGISVFGGLISSASTTATAATLASQGEIAPNIAGIGTVLTSITSALVNLPIVYRQVQNKSLARRLTFVSIIVVCIGIASLGAVIEFSRGPH